MKLLVWILIGLFPLAVGAVLWRRRRRVPPVWMLAGACALGILAGIVARREPLPELTAARLQSARSAWSTRGPREYDLDVLVHADRLEDGHFEVRVRAGTAPSTTRNGLPTTGVEAGYTIPALFDMLERELELAETPQAGFGAPAGYRAYLRARFHAELGYPEKYRRVAGGVSNGVEITVTRFTPVEK